MPPEPRKSLMRNLGEFFGHIWKGVRTEPRKRVLRKDVQQEKRGDVTLRRTTIDEIEIKDRESRA